MTGKTIKDFICGLYDNPEIEFVFKGEAYILSGFVDADDMNYTLELYNISRSFLVFQTTNVDRDDCVSYFEEAKIFDGKTIYEAESEIEVLYG